MKYRHCEHFSIKQKTGLSWSPDLWWSSVAAGFPWCRCRKAQTPGGRIRGPQWKPPQSKLRDSPGGFSPPLWKIWVRQLGWLETQYIGKYKMFQTTNQLSDYQEIRWNAFWGFKKLDSGSSQESMNWYELWKPILLRRMPKLYLGNICL